MYIFVTLLRTVGQKWLLLMGFCLPQVKYEMETTKWIVEGLDHFGHKTAILPLGGSTVQVVIISEYFSFSNFYFFFSEINGYNWDSSWHIVLGAATGQRNRRDYSKCGLP